MTDIRHLTDDDVPEAVRMFALSLGESAPKEPDRYLRYWDVPASLGAFDERGRVLGIAARFDSRLTAVGGEPLVCGGVPSVGVRPDAHGQGIGRALLRRQVEEARDRGDDVLVLNASEQWIYGRYGYGPTSRWWSVKADPRNLAWRDDAPAPSPGSVDELTIEEASEVLRPLYERCFGRWGGELERTEGMWHLAFTPRKDSPPPLIAVHRDGDGTPDAAARFTVRMDFDDLGFANELEVHDLFGIDPGAEGVLARWLCQRNLVGRIKADRWNPRSPVPWMLVDGRRWLTTADADGMWLRVLDVPTVASARTADGVGHVTVRVVDDLVPDNDRTWRLGAVDGRLTCEPAGGPADVTVDVGLLASMLWGHASPTTLASAGRLEVADRAALATLDRLLAVPGPSWSSTNI